MSYKTEFSSENFLSLGRACYEIGKLMEDLFNSYETLLIPSRGAWPLAEVAVGICKYRAKRLGEEDKLSDVRTISLLKGYAGFKNFKGIKEQDENGKQIIVAPLTADVSIENNLIGVKGMSKDELSEMFTEEIRKYGARLIISFYKSPEERKEDPYFKFFDFLLREVEGRDDLAQEYENFPAIHKAIMMDTAISGRAFTTVMKNLIELGRQPYGLLAVDKDGRKLKKEYKQWLSKWRNSGNLFMTTVHTILSEDRGAGLLGVSAVIYPQLMVRFKNILSPLGAVTWHPLPKYKEYRETFSSFERTLFEAAKVAWAEEEMPERKSKYLDSFNKRLGEFHKIVEKYGSRVLIAPVVRDNFIRYPYEKIAESSAHVIHVYFSKRTLDKLYRLFQSFIKTDLNTNYRLR